MPSSSGWSSFFHVGAKTWRPKTADQSYLEFERKKVAEESERKEAEVKQKLHLLDQVRKLEAKTQTLNEMALSAEIQTKEHELAMRERQMAESKQIELAKLELAKRMGQESLNEADFARVRRERMKAELLARQSNDHALRELDRASGQSEIDERLAAHMPQPPSFIPPDGLSMPMRGNTPMAGPIPMPGNHMPMSGPMSVPGHMYMPGPMSMPGHTYMSPSGPQPTFDHHDGMPMGPQTRLRGRSESFSTYPVDMGRGEWGPHNNMLHERGLRLSDHLDHQRMHPPSRDSRNHDEPMALQMILRAQAELVRRKKLEKLDQNAMQHNFKMNALREMRKRELIARLRERGLHQHQIEAEATKLAQHIQCMNEAELRAEREEEYLHILREKGLQERELTDQLKRREENDRQILQKEIETLERESRHKDLAEAEREIRKAANEGRAPPMGITRPSVEKIKAEHLLDDMWTEFPDLNPRLQHEIISLQAHYKPTGGVGMCRAPTPKTREHILQEMANQLYREDHSRASMRSASRSSLRDHSHAPTSLSRSSSTRQGNNSPGPSRLANRPPSRCLDANGPPLSLPRRDLEPESSQQISGSDASAIDASLSARLHSAALNSEINGGRRSRASSRAGQMNDNHPMARHRPDLDPSPLNPNVGRRSRASTVTEQLESEILQGGPRHAASELGSGARSRSNSTAQSHGTSPQSRMSNERYINLAMGRSPAGSDHGRSSRPASRLNMPGTSNVDRNYDALAHGESFQTPIDHHMSDHRPDLDHSPINPNPVRRSRASTIAEQMDASILRGVPHHVSSEVGPDDGRSRSSSTAHSSRPLSKESMPGPSFIGNKYNNLTDESLSSLPTEALEMMLAGGQVDPSMMPNMSLNLQHIQPGDVDREQLAALSGQHQGSLYANMSSSNVEALQSHPADGRPASTRMGGASPSSSLRRQSSMNRDPRDASRSSSRGGTSSSHHSGLEGRDSRNNSHSPLNPSNRNSLGNSKSLYSMAGRHDMYASQNEGGRSSSQDGCDYPAEANSVDDEFVITERREHEGATIVDNLGRVEASSRDNASHPQRIDTLKAGLNDRNEMHSAVKNMISEASRRGANGVVSLRVHDLKDGSYVASGEAVVLVHH
ncbi:hypothetical protein PGT21_008745 [Puccinia graminis f. sp. tritici]|uniref:Uncharacterized protein n=1 Tax=Puccinia graminis f. sp. tritici TaxID=56615 RepID=A0A5B0PTV2_PUCGR|nr:hypothetical protein PGT21_008745 [Puccinia graminis f. sp. tritici]KAA1128269.1 hypothetical protein PGTUg99_019707 [Puccinia graminis f. sp. tritici]